MSSARLEGLESFRHFSSEILENLLGESLSLSANDDYFPDGCYLYSVKYTQIGFSDFPFLSNELKYISTIQALDKEKNTFEQFCLKLLFYNSTFLRNHYDFLKSFWPKYPWQVKGKEVVDNNNNNNERTEARRRVKEDSQLYPLYISSSLF